MLEGIKSLKTITSLPEEIHKFLLSEDFLLGSKNTDRIKLKEKVIYHKTLDIDSSSSYIAYITESEIAIEEIYNYGDSQASDIFQYTINGSWENGIWITDTFVEAYNRFVEKVERIRKYA
jgi:hypothetical protein